MEQETQDAVPAATNTSEGWKSLPLQRLTRLAWLPIPVLLLLLVVLYLRPPGPDLGLLPLLPVFNFVFLALAGFLAAGLAARTYLTRGSPTILFLGAGTLAYATTALLASWPVPGGDYNTGSTTWYLGVSLAGFFSLLSAFSLQVPIGRPYSRASLGMLVPIYSAVLLALTAICLAARHGLLPTFFVKGVGPTALRHTMLGIALLEFTAASLLLLLLERHNRSAFLHWYALGLALIAVGQFGSIGYNHYDSLTCWVDRGCHYLGGIYLLVAVIAAMRQSGSWMIPLATLHETYDRYTRLVNASPDAILVLVEGRIVFANPAAARLFGASSSRPLLGLHLLDLVHPACRSSAEDCLTRSLSREQAAAVLEIKVLRRDRSAVDVELATSPVTDDDQPAVQVVLRDITERKQIEDTLRFLADCDRTASDQDFFQKLARYLARSLNMEFICIDRLEGDLLVARTVALYCDGHFQDNVSYMLKDTPCGAVVREDRCCYPKDVRLLFPSDPVLQEMSADGYVGTILRSTEGRPIGLIAILSRKPVAHPELASSILQLVSGRAAAELERRQAEEALRASEASLAKAQAIAHLANWELDAGSNTVRGSNELYRLFSVGPDATLDGYVEKFHPEDRPRVVEAIHAAIHDGKSYSIDYRIVPQPGRVRYVHAEGEVAHNDGGRPITFFGTVQDITERKQAEQQLKELNATLEQRVAERTTQLQQRAEQLRDLAVQLGRSEQQERQRLATILHDHLQQLLVGAKFQLRIAQSQVADDNLRQCHTDLNELLSQSLEACRDLTVSLSPPILKHGNMKESLCWLAGWMQSKHHLHVTIEADEQAHPPSEEVRTLLFQAVRELLFNIVKHAGVNEASVEFKRLDDKSVQAVVRDQGAGFGPCEPAADSAGGSGFGLLAIRERIRYLGGSFQICSRPGEGTCVTLTVPVELPAATDSTPVGR